MRQMRYKKIARAIVKSIVEEFAALLLRNREPSLYYSAEKHIQDAMEGAWKEGYETHRAESLKAIKDFEDSKDPIGS